MFNKVLIANRGEIACRIIRTCERLGIATVAVYSDADAHAQHVKLAGEAIHIGGSLPSESYLRADLIITAARSCVAEAIHPGYGFLSENAAFARACVNAGLAFIGPSPEAIEKMGSKSAAKRIMQAAGVPVVPGYHGEDQDAQLLEQEAEQIGYPVLIKAVAGGGGKGMRVVYNSADFVASLEAARREAKSAFANDAVLIEKFIAQPHHIEFQIFGDRHGNVVHLFERECSIQRRHQKVLEETPSPFLDEALRREMGAAAVAAAKAIGYVNAGTIEFIVGADRRFYFMEMNTRLQVEHPITEMITGLDLVEWQLRVAAGEPLPLRQIPRHGHAIEVRICAENPANDFLPDTGTLSLVHFPSATAHTRVDTGVVSGDAVSVFYDSMIAKLIVWGEDRVAAIERLRAALAHTAIIGPRTNLGLLQRLANNPAYRAGDTDTHFIAQHRFALFARDPEENTLIAAAALRLMHDQDAHSTLAAARSSDFASPWWHADGWRLNSPAQRTLQLKRDNDHITLQATRLGDRVTLSWEGGDVTVAAHTFSSDELALQIRAEIHKLLVARAGHRIQVAGLDRRLELREIDFDEEFAHADAPGGRLTALMPGRVIKVFIAAGEAVNEGQPLLIMEAMKMEHTITSPRAGVIEAVFYRENDLVPAEAVLFAYREAR